MYGQSQSQANTTLTCLQEMIWSRGTGTYTVFVSIDTGQLARPTNVRYAPEGSAIQVSWNPVEGADYYNIYHDEIFDSGCRLAGDGSPSVCEELATNVVEITYVHDNPGNDTNYYYWVVACRPRECSKIDSVNPPISLETSSTGPTISTSPTPIPPRLIHRRHRTSRCRSRSLHFQHDLREDNRNDRIYSSYPLARSPDSSGHRRRPERL